MRLKNSQPALECLRDSLLTSFATVLSPSPNTAYTLRASPLPLATLGDIAPFGHNVVYAGNVRRKSAPWRIHR